MWDLMPGVMLSSQHRSPCTMLSVSVTLNTSQTNTNPNSQASEYRGLGNLEGHSELVSMCYLYIYIYTYVYIHIVYRSLPQTLFGLSRLYATRLSEAGDLFVLVLSG